MFTRLSKTTYKIELNEYITEWADITAHVDDLVDSTCSEVLFINDGCNKSYVVRKLFKELRAHDIKVITNE